MSLQFEPTDRRHANDRNRRKYDIDARVGE